MRENLPIQIGPWIGPPDLDFLSVNRGWLWSHWFQENWRSRFFCVRWGRRGLGRLGWIFGILRNVLIQLVTDCEFFFNFNFWKCNYCILFSNLLIRKSSFSVRCLLHFFLDPRTEIRVYNWKYNSTLIIIRIEFFSNYWPLLLKLIDYSNYSVIRHSPNKGDSNAGEDLFLLKRLAKFLLFFFSNFFPTKLLVASHLNILGNATQKERERRKLQTASLKLAVEAALKTRVTRRRRRRRWRRESRARVIGASMRGRECKMKGKKKRKKWANPPGRVTG